MVHLWIWLFSLWTPRLLHCCGNHHHWHTKFEQPSTIRSYAHHQLNQVYHQWFLCSWQLVPTLLMVSHLPPCMVVLCSLLITLEEVHLLIYLQSLMMGVCVFVIKNNMILGSMYGYCTFSWLRFTLNVTYFVFELAMFTIMFFLGVNTVLHNAFLYVVILQLFALRSFSFCSVK